MAKQSAPKAKRKRYSMPGLAREIEQLHALRAQDFRSWSRRLDKLAIRVFCAIAGAVLIAVIFFSIAVTNG
jgi:hypothetical protein